MYSVVEILVAQWPEGHDSVSVHSFETLDKARDVFQKLKPLKGESKEFVEKKKDGDEIHMSTKKVLESGYLATIYITGPHVPGHLFFDLPKKG